MVGEIMKYIFAAMLVMPLSSYAICFNKVEITGYGQDKTRASQDADKKANNACGAGDYSWSVKKTDYIYTDLTNGEDRFYSAKAQFQCCGSW
jgi:hypothetical protein